MLPRVLSIAIPLSVYLSLGILVWALYRNRARLDYRVGLVVVSALLASVAFADPGHRLFYDEDIYIQIASNLARAPVAQLTLLGSPAGVDVATYFKTPAGYPAILGFLFLATGTAEWIAFLLARFLFALAAGAIYLLGCEVASSRWAGAVAAALFVSVPVSLDFSASAGTDIPAALFATLGFWGLSIGSAPLAVAGLALAAQVRLEAIVLVAFMLHPVLERRWRLAGLALVGAEVAHLAWLLSSAPAYAAVENVDAAFSLGYAGTNLAGIVRYLFDPSRFPALLVILAAVSLGAALWKRGAAAGPRLRALHLAGWAGTLLVVYLFFYAGSFDFNPRYAIQVLPAVTMLATGAIVAAGPRARGLLLATVAASIAWAHTGGVPREDDLLLAEDHRRMVEIARAARPDELIIGGEVEVILNHGAAGMNAVYASERPDRVVELGEHYSRVLYYPGARAAIPDSQLWRADRAIRQAHAVRPVETYRFRGRTTTLYEVGPPVAGVPGRFSGRRSLIAMGGVFE